MNTRALALLIGVGCGPSSAPPEAAPDGPAPSMIPEAAGPAAASPRPTAVPEGSIESALANVPGSVASMYDLSLSADQHKLTIDPAVIARRDLGSRAGGVIAEDSENGGKILQLGGGKFDRGAWTRGNLGTWVSDAAGRKALAEAGYAIDVERDLLVVTGENDSDPTVFAFSGDAGKRGLVAVCSEVSVFDFSRPTPMMVARKPVIYLYPKRPMQVQVDVALEGSFVARYPKPDADGWHVWAEPDGLLKDATGREHRYLFWEGVGAELALDRDEAWCIPGSESAEFLERVCAANALTDVECGDFVTYWLPSMVGNPYNVIGFPDEAYAKYAALTVDPTPDTVIRLFMVFRASDKPVKVGSPALPTRERRGFTVVEWGGAELDAR